MQTVRRMARQAIAADVRLKVSAPALPLHCAGDRTGLEMALLNLCLNAGHATPAGGSINLDAREVRLDRSDRLGLTAGAYVALTVRDTGAGMSPEVLARATDPLFTTKAAGTGLGLSAVRDFAATAGGALSLWSREGHGTRRRPSICPSPSPTSAPPRRPNPDPLDPGPRKRGPGLFRYGAKTGARGDSPSLRTQNT